MIRSRLEANLDVSNACEHVFEVNLKRLKLLIEEHQQGMMLVNDREDGMALNYGVRIASDLYKGCTRLRTLRALLKHIDTETRFERSPHQVRFHEAFIRASARAIYGDEWKIHRDPIMRHNKWPTARSEVLISTPR